MSLRIAAACLLTLLLGSPAIARDDGDYGAIAYSRRTGHYGYATHHRSRRAAEDRALDECARRDCKIEVWFRDNCAALATGSEGQVVGWAYNRRLEEAKENAIEQCRAHDGRHCRVVVSACSR